MVRFSTRRNKGQRPPQQPRQHHPGERPDRLDSDGHLMGHKEQAEKWKKEGLCGKCGITKTHNVSGLGFMKLRTPLSVENQVYKGLCLRCMSITQAHMQLNEPVHHGLRPSISAQQKPPPHHVVRGDSCRPPHPQLNRGGENHTVGYNNNVPNNSTGSIRRNNDLSGSSRRNDDLSGSNRKNDDALHNNSACRLLNNDQNTSTGRSLDYVSNDTGKSGRGDYEYHPNNNQGDWIGSSDHVNNAGNGGGTPYPHTNDALEDELNSYLNRNVPTIVCQPNDDEISCISFDQSIMTHNSGSSNENRPKKSETNLPGITEEQSINDIDSGIGSGSQEQGNNSSYNRLLERKLAENNTDTGSQGNIYSRVNSNSSVRVGSVPGTDEGDRHNRLLERKLAENNTDTASQGHNSIPSKSYTRTNSTPSVTRVGPVAIGPDDPSNCLLERKLAGRDANIGSQDQISRANSTPSATGSVGVTEEGDRYNRLLEKKLAGDNIESGSQGHEIPSQNYPIGNSGRSKTDDGDRYNRLLERKLAENEASSGSQDQVSQADSYARTNSTPSATTRVGSGDAYNRLLERKMADNTSQGGKYSRSDSFHAPQAASPSIDTSHVHFEDKDLLAERAQSTDLSARIQEKTANAGHVRAKSDGQAISSPTRPRQGHVRSSTHGDTLTTTTTMNSQLQDQEERRRKKLEEFSNAPRKSSQEAEEEFHRRVARKAASTSSDSSETPRVTETLPESEALRLVDDCSNCIELIVALKRTPKSPQTVILTALRKLRGYLFQTHEVSNKETPDRSRSDSTVALTGSGWAKVIMTVMSSHSSDVVVQSEVLQTLWEVVSLHPRYVSDLTTNADLEQIVIAMETYTQKESIQEYGAGLLSCIAASQKHALLIVTMFHGKFIQRLMMALQFKGPKGNVQVNSLKALFLLSSASISSGSTGHFTTTMGRYTHGSSSVSAITSVIDTMRHYLENANVQIYGNRLLWNIFDPDAILDQDYVDILRGSTFQHLELAKPCHLKSQAYNESAVCLLSKMSCSGDDSRCREAFLRVVVGTMKLYPHSAIIALHGCSCLANMCVRSETLLDSQTVIDSIPVVLLCTKTFRDNVAIQSEACGAIASIIRFSPSNKERVWQNSGIDSVVAAFDCSYDPCQLETMTQYEDLCVVTKIRACNVLISLAVDPIILSDMEEKGISTKFERLLEEDSNIPVALMGVVQRLLDLVSDKENSDRKLVFREDSSEEKTCDCIRANLRLIPTPEFTSNRTGYLMSNTLRSMRSFPDSVDIHANGCKLLACLFEIASNDKVAMDMIESTDKLALVELIAFSLAQHKNNIEAVAVICSALQNYCVLMCSPGRSGAQALNDVLSRCLALEKRTLVIHQEDEAVLERVTGALWALCTLKEELALTSEMTSSIGLIVGAMNRFPTRVGLQINCIGLLGVMANDVMNFVNDELVIALVSFLELDVGNDDKAVISTDTAVNIILVISNKGYTAVTTLLENEQLIDALVCTMYKYPSSTPLQGACSSILNNIALDNFLRDEVCKKGGTSRIIVALDNLKQDQILATKAFAALANLVSGAAVDVLQANDAPAPQTFINAMKAHPHCLRIQIDAAFALWALSARDDSFKDEIVNLGGIDAIVSAMNQFLASKQMQLRGFVVLWSCSVPKHLKASVGQRGIEAVVNGMSAHISSEEACQEALGCLKCLSTVVSNKEILDEQGALDLIFSCLWLHLGNATLCKSALAALCNVSVNVESNQVSEITGEDIDAIVHAMRAHLNVKGVQESAIYLLRNYTFSPTNVSILEGACPQLTNLIKAAKANHNNHFRGKADELLRVLPRQRLGT